MLELQWALILAILSCYNKGPTQKDEDIFVYLLSYVYFLFVKTLLTLHLCFQINPEDIDYILKVCVILTAAAVGATT